MTIIEADGLSKAYGDLMAVREIDFSIEKGECFGFLGPNGAGKTTTVQMIHCFRPITSGRLTVFGLDVRTHPREIKARLGLVPQEDNLDPELSVIDNLLVYASYFGLRGPSIRARAEELLDFVGLTEKRTVQVEHLSGGMKRRLAIARGLINRPELLILDEPTTGLDPEARHVIWQKLRQLKSEGVTLLLTTHYLEEAAQLCDRLVIMDHGEIIVRGRPQELVDTIVGPQVLEVQANPEEIESIQRQLGQSWPDFLRVGNLLFFYPGERGEELLAASGHFNVSRRLLRQSNLEDVFLKLTGRELA